MVRILRLFFTKAFFTVSPHLKISGQKEKSIIIGKPKWVDSRHIFIC